MYRTESENPYNSLFNSSRRWIVLNIFPHFLHCQSVLFFFAFLCNTSRIVPHMGQAVSSPFHRPLRNIRVSSREFMLSSLICILSMSFPFYSLQNLYDMRHVTSFSSVSSGISYTSGTDISSLSNIYATRGFVLSYEISVSSSIPVTDDP